MQNLRRPLLILIVALLFLSAGASANAAKPPIHDDLVVWQLTKARVVEQGQTIVTEEGTLINGFVVEAKAKSRHNNLVRDGTFRLELTLFQPRKDMPGQVAGRWYVQGKWVIDANGKPAANKERHKLGTARGFIRSDLDFNPAIKPSNWSASAVMPMSTVDARWLKGEGAYSVNAAWEGDLFLQLKLWPEAR